MALSKSGYLYKLSAAKQSQLIGEVTSLLMVSKVHRKFQVRDIADITLPALNLNQFRMYRDANKRPIAFVTWAKFSTEVEKKYLAGKAVLSEAELSSGDILYLTDFIAPYGNTKQIIADLKSKVFRDEYQLKALRFTEQGKTRSNVWKFSRRVN